MNKLVPCPYCSGSGKVSKERAEKKITVRNRAAWNRKMRAVNAKTRAAKVAK